MKKSNKSLYCQPKQEEKVEEKPKENLVVPLFSADRTMISLVLSSFFFFFLFPSQLRPGGRGELTLEAGGEEIGGKYKIMEKEEQSKKSLCCQPIQGEKVETQKKA